jgi:hypothetical protein
VLFGDDTDCLTKEEMSDKYSMLLPSSLDGSTKDPATKPLPSGSSLKSTPSVKRPRYCIFIDSSYR